MTLLFVEGKSGETFVPRVAPTRKIVGLHNIDHSNNYAPSLKGPSAIDNSFKMVSILLSGRVDIAASI